MKPSTHDRIDRIVGRAAPFLTPGQEAALREIVEFELRAQDRETRHACAETVNQLFPYDQWCVLFKSDAHRAVIDTQSI